MQIYDGSLLICKALSPVSLSPAGLHYLVLCSPLCSSEGHFVLLFIACFSGRKTDTTHETTLTAIVAMCYHQGSVCLRSPNAPWHPTQTCYYTLPSDSWNLLQTQKAGKNIQQFLLSEQYLRDKEGCLPSLLLVEDLCI